MFIQTEDTPNPATMKFLPSCAVTETPVDFRSPREAAVSPLAVALFEQEGVTGVYLGRDFISVTRAPDCDWTVLRPSVLATIMDHFASGQPAVTGHVPEAEARAHADDADVVAQIKELIETRIRPGLSQDGGDVAFEGYENGVVFLRLKGACAGCPSATATLKNGIENMMRYFIPEVQEVRRVG